MGFVWEPMNSVTISAYVEMRDAVNSLTDGKEASRYSWQESIPVSGERITASRYSELQDATDYADDKNVCNSDKSAHYDTYDTNENSSDNSTEDVNEDETNRTTVYTDQDSGYDSSLDGTYNGTKDDTVYTDQDSGYDSGLDSNYDSGDNYSVYSDQDSGYDSGLDSGYDSGENETVYSGYDAGYDSSYDYGYDSTLNGTIHSTADAGYDSSLDSSYNSTKNDTICTAQDVGYDSSYDYGYDSSLNGTIYSDYDGGVDGSYYTTDRSSEDSSYDGSYMGNEHSCFTGCSLTVTATGEVVRVDQVKVGDLLIGYNGEINPVLAIDKVLLGSRSLWRLHNTSCKFTLEHPFKMFDGSWGAFDKDAIDKEIASVSEGGTIPVIVDGEEYLLHRDFSTYNSDTIAQIYNGAPGVDIHSQKVPLRIYPISDRDEFIYSFVMGGNRTWNAEGIIISGVAMGENPRLEKV